MNKQRFMYKVETSATFANNLQAPINGAVQNVQIRRSGRIVGVRAYVTAVAVDNETVPAPQVWNMPCLGRVAINHGTGIYANDGGLSPAWTSIHFENRVQEALNIPVSPGTLPISLYVNPIYLAHVKGTTRWYTNVNVSISVVIEVEED